MVGVEQGIGVVEVELSTEEVETGQDLVVEVQPDIDEGEIVVVVVAVKHIVEMDVAEC